MVTRLLVVDDEAPVRFGVSEYFRTKGWVVESASSLEEVKRLCDTRAFDAVVTDLRLGDNGPTEGLDVIAAVRNRSATTRILLLTAYGSSLVEAAARHLGADRFLLKPIPLPELARELGTLVGQAS